MIGSIVIGGGGDDDELCSLATEDERGGTRYTMRTVQYVQL